MMAQFISTLLLLDQVGQKQIARQEDVAFLLGTTYFTPPIVSAPW